MEPLTPMEPIRTQEGALNSVKKDSINPTDMPEVDGFVLPELRSSVIQNKRDNAN